VPRCAAFAAAGKQSGGASTEARVPRHFADFCAAGSRKRRFLGVFCGKYPRKTPESEYFPANVNKMKNRY
jgi:hypothetical protein